MALNDLTLTQKKVQCITGTRVVLDPVEQRKEKTGDGHAAAAAAAATAGTSSSAGEVGTNSNAGEDTSSNAGEGTSLNAGEGTNSNTSGGTSPSAGEGTSTDPQDTSTKSSAKSSETNKHSQELLNYYIQVARAILGGSTSLLKVALKDLMSNPRIGPVCPYFFNLIALSINKLPRHDWLTNALLSTVEAILENPYVDPSSYLAAKRTINSLLVIAIEPKVAKNCDDFLLRTRAARLLSEVLDAWNIDQKIQNDIVRQLMQLLLDKKISLQTQFGAIYSLISLEHFSLSSHFWPVIGRYIPILEEKQNSDVLLATQVGGCIQLAAAKMYIDEWTQDVTVDEWKRRLKVDHMLYEHFGDALVPIRQDFSITGPYFYSKPNGNFEESFPTEEEDQPTYEPTSAVNMEVEDTSSNNVTPAINFTKNSPIVFKIEHARQIELKMNRKLCSIQMPLYTESPKSFRSIWNRQTLYKNTRTIKYCVESHLKSPAGYLYLIL
ncbi:uncharacterized protein LOC111047830 isoform X2 [Nilaparvata lugens]|nr:uncharacterized protein LOC111047830 isoform X2 [Nilaparvata lugens]